MTVVLRDIGRLAAIGAALVALRSFVSQAIALGGMAVLTHELSPHDFGLVAFGLAITAFATAFADVGLAAGLIRTPSAPTSDDLRAALGLQAVAMTALAVIVAAAVAPFGTAGRLTSLMLVSLPLAAWQTPARVLLERDLAYRRLSTIELAQSVVYWIAAVAAVVGGAGVWGVAAATVLQTAVGTMLLLWKVPAGRIRPLVSWRSSRKLVRFGLSFQAINFTNLVRDQGLNLAVAGVLGMSALGIWNVASRVLRVPLTLFSAIWRVSYPAMARVVHSDAEPRELLERGVTVAALACGALLAPLGGASVAFVPLVFGSSWREAGVVLAPACGALMIGGPISLAVGGYLYATGAIKAVLSSVVLHTIAWFAVALPLLPLIGVRAVGIGWILGAFVDAVVLAWAAKRSCGAHVLARAIEPLIAACVAGGCAFWLGSSFPSTLLVAISSLLVAFVGYLLLIVALVALRPRRSAAVDLRSAARVLRVGAAGAIRVSA